nr:putative RNA-directed DNA polymerase [Tanacetum cinerariifolium]
DIGKLGAKGDIGFFIGYSANSCAYRVYNQRIKKIMETMNVTFDELLAMAFEQCKSKPGLQSMNSRQISSRLDLTYAPSTITSQKPTKREFVEESALTPKNSSSQSPKTPITSEDFDELEPQQQHVQQLDNQASLQPKIVDDNVPNEMFDGDVFENPFAP